MQGRRRGPRERAVGSQWGWVVEERAAFRKAAAEGNSCEAKLEAAAGLKWAEMEHPKESPVLATWCHLRRPYQLGSAPGPW